MKIQKRNGLDSVFFRGDDWEGLSLTLEEKMQLTESAIGACRGRLRTIIHVGCTLVPGSSRAKDYYENVCFDLVECLLPLTSLTAEAYTNLLKLLAQIDFFDYSGGKKTFG